MQENGDDFLLESVSDELLTHIFRQVSPIPLLLLPTNP